MQHQTDRRSIRRVVWDDLPLIFFAFFAVGTAHAEMVSLHPPRLDLVWSFIFPLAVPVAVYALSWRHAASRRRAVALAVVVGTPALILLIHRLVPPRPLAPAEIRGLYEVVSIGIALLLGVHAWVRRREMALLLFGPVALYGMALENGGILLGFFSEAHYSLYLGPLPAPLSTMIGWVTVFYLALHVAWEVRRLVPALRRSALGSAMVGTAAVLLLDLQVDAFATAAGLWQWHVALPSNVMGVPVLNFVAWLCAVLPLTYLVFLREKALGLQVGEIAARPHLRWFSLRVPGAFAVASVLFLVCMGAIEGGINGPTFTVFRQAVP